MKRSNIKELKYGVRYSRMSVNEVYFWTNTIKDWKNLLQEDWFKSTVIGSWKTLVQQKRIIIYGFVIMPNHLHVLWQLTSLNGKEMPHASFNKFTSHQFLKRLKTENQSLLYDFKVNERERNYRFWQRDALAIKMDSLKKFEQKLDYIHLNPLQPKWSFVERPEDYYWSSAKYYETGKDEFQLLTHYATIF